MVQQEAYLKYGILMLFALYIWNKDVISQKIQISPDKGETTLLVIIFISKKPDPAPSSSAADSVLINDEMCGIRAHLGFSSAIRSGIPLHPHLLRGSRHELVEMSDQGRADLV